MIVRIIVLVFSLAFGGAYAAQDPIDTMRTMSKMFYQDAHNYKNSSVMCLREAKRLGSDAMNSDYCRDASAFATNPHMERTYNNVVDIYLELSESGNDERVIPPVVVDFINNYSSGVESMTMVVSII